MQPLPSQLYRYRSVDGPAQARTQRIIETGLHYFASPTSFNDPFDCRPNFALDSDENSVREYLYGMWARQAPHMSEEARKQEVDAILQDPARDPRIPENNMIFAAVYDSLVTAQIGVLCLSEVKDSILMWSHYADCHHGVCLVYDTDNEFFVNAQPVRYSVSGLASTQSFTPTNRCLTTLSSRSPTPGHMRRSGAFFTTKTAQANANLPTHA